MVLIQAILFFSNIKMKYLNAQTKNLGNDEGDVLSKQVKKFNTT